MALTGACTTPLPSPFTPELTAPGHSYDLRSRASSPHVFGTFTPTNEAIPPVVSSDDDAVLSASPVAAELVHTSPFPPPVCASTTDFDYSRAPSAVSTPPHTAPVETKDSLDQGSVGVAPTAVSSATVYDTVTRLRGGADSPTELEVDYFQDTDTNCVTVPGDIPFSTTDAGNLPAHADFRPSFKRSGLLKMNSRIDGTQRAQYVHRRSDQHEHSNRVGES